MYSGITSEFDQGGGEIASQSNKTNFGSHYHKLFNQTSGVSRTNEGNGTMSFALDVDNRILRGYYNTRLIFTDTSIPNATTTDYAPFVFQLMEAGVLHILILDKDLLYSHHLMVMKQYHL